MWRTVFLTCIVVLALPVGVEAFRTAQGYTVNDLQAKRQGNIVTVHGTLRGGAPAELATVSILLENETGYQGWCEAPVASYDGSTRRFTSEFRHYPVGKVWSVQAVHVQNNGPAEKVARMTAEDAVCTVSTDYPATVRIYTYDDTLLTSFTVEPGKAHRLSIGSGYYKCVIHGQEKEARHAIRIFCIIIFQKIDKSHYHAEWIS